jgi:predicted lipoprotein with Yx(FWY)xxD motif
MGRALYLFTADGQGESTCDEECAGAWPPFTSVEPPRAAAAGLNGDLIGTKPRADGTRQVTYNGWPLYLYASDIAPGHHMGHGVKEHGGEWYLVSPTGEAVPSMAEPAR